MPAPRCAHRWRIAEPEGPKSSGFCLTCGETKDFENSHWSDRQYTDRWHKANYKSAGSRTRVDSSEWGQW